MSVTAGLAIGGAAAGLLGGLFSSSSQQATARENLRLQRENLDWQKHVQQETWNREDTAIQRQKQDLIAAGMNPYMAMNGSGANAGSVVSTQAPQEQIVTNQGQVIADSLGRALDVYKAVQQAKQSAYETEYMKYNLWNDFGVNHPTSTFYWDNNGNAHTDIIDNWSLPKNIGDVRNSWYGKMNSLDYVKSSAQKEGIDISNDILKIDRDFATINNISHLLLDGISAYGRIRQPYLLKPKFSRR